MTTIETRMAETSVTSWRGWRHIAKLAAIFATARLTVVLVALASNWLSTTRQTIYGAFTKWDSGWYGFIADHGYPNNLNVEAGGNRWAFFPGWPYLVRATQLMFGGTWQRNGIILSILLGFLSIIVLDMLVSDQFGNEVAEKTIVLFLVQPAAAALSMVYSEVLFIPAAFACMLFLGRRRWLLAGIAAAVASGTRISGIAVIAACLVEAVLQWRRDGSFRPFLAPALAPLGLVSFFVYQRIRVGRWDAYQHAQSYWGNGTSFGRSVLRAFGRLVTSSSAWDYPPNVLIPIVLALAVAGGICLWRVGGAPASWWVYGGVLSAVALSSLEIYNMPRLFLPMFPFVAGLAARWSKSTWSLLIAVSAVVMAIVALLYFNTTAFQMAP
jgi:hypothetical protein